MTKLSETIAAYDVVKKERLPADILTTLNAAIDDLKATGIEKRAVKIGDTAPSFTLKNHLGKERSLSGMLKDSALVVSFYRGGW